MDNVVQLRNTGGFTRMDNELYEALIWADLSRRDMKAVMAIHRLTAGYNKSEARIAASVIADMAGIHRTEASRAISSLLEQRVIYRVGGSRGALGVSPVSEWNIKQSLTVESSSQCEKVRTLSVVVSSHNKDRKDNTTSDEVVSAPTAKPVVELPAKTEKPAKAKATGFTLSNLLADNPHGVSEQVLADWLTCRSKLRAAVTATVWKRVNAELAKCAAFGITADDAMAEAQEAGWRGFKAEWLINRQRSNAPAKRAAGPDFHSDDISWANDLGPL